MNNFSQAVTTYMEMIISSNSQIGTSFDIKEIKNRYTCYVPVRDFNGSNLKAYYVTCVLTKDGDEKVVKVKHQDAITEVIERSGNWEKFQESFLPPEWQRELLR